MSVTEQLAIGVALVMGIWTLWRWVRPVGMVSTMAWAMVAMALNLPVALGASVLCGGLLLRFAPDALKQPLSPDAKVRHWNGLRGWTQAFFAAALAAAGVQYGLHVWQLGSGAAELARPNVVDAFLPIAAMIQLKAWLQLGLWDSHHPAGLVMLLAALGLSLTVKRAFCGWVCPMGGFGEQLYQWRKQAAKRLGLNWDARARLVQKPQWLQRTLGWTAKGLDWALRLVKYGLLLSLVNLVMNGMPAMMVARYLQGMYHQAADLKMWAMFTQPSLLIVVSLAAILILAALRRNAFCRYLCPYGAMMALVGFISPLKVRRDTAHCLREGKGMQCDKCHQACPSRIAVHQVITVQSDECNSCQRCVAACPAKGALGSRLPVVPGTLKPKQMVLLLVLFLFLLPLAFHAADLWASNTDPMMRQMLLRSLDNLPMF
ncbi:4Fe-4S binding protein [Ferrimonas marina]|uniref:4Fe-4S binding domain-containing protein n=1 Tax=Ferrimonas marina TaxID=299255 RepID=A0A1M5Z5M7_9GAMM|nr:4Fe-4S binding protein [Ferrimonas marina]SHI19542.1 4Fe-4S binding domain-containing protein [Ferrimonas marina]